MRRRGTISGKKTSPGRKVKTMSSIIRTLFYYTISCIRIESRLRQWRRRTKANGGRFSPVHPGHNQLQCLGGMRCPYNLRNSNQPVLSRMWVYVGMKYGFWGILSTLFRILGARPRSLLRRRPARPIMLGHLAIVGRRKKPSF